MQKTLQLPESQPATELANLCQHLRTHGGWISSKELGNALGYDERKIRALASASSGTIVSGPGSKGYKHIALCTGEEVNKITGLTMAQAKKMAHRSGQIRRAFHSQDKKK